MFANELKIWYAFVLYAFLLNATGLACYYWNPSPAPPPVKLPEVSFRKAAQDVDADSTNVVVLIECQRDDHSREKLTVHGDIDGDAKSGFTIEVPPGAKEGRLTLSAAQLPPVQPPARERTVVLRLGGHRTYTLGSIKEHTLTLRRKAPTMIVEFADAGPTRLGATARGGKVRLRCTPPPESALPVRFAVKQDKDRLRPGFVNEVVIGKGESGVDIDFQVSPEPGDKRDYLARFVLEPAAGGAYELGTARHADVVLASSYQKPVVQSITASAAAMREGSGRWTVTAQLDRPVAEPVVLMVRVEGTARENRHYKAVPATLTIPAMATRGELAVELVDNDDFEPQGVELTVVLTARGEVELPGGDTVRRTLRIEDDDSEGDIAVLVLLTPQLKEDWPAVMRELRKVQDGALGRRVLGRRIFLVPRSGEPIAWRVPNKGEALPAGLQLFAENVPINDHFVPALRAIGPVTQNARNKALATYLVYVSATDPDLAAKRSGGNFETLEIPRENATAVREIYVGWVTNHPLAQQGKLPPDHWLNRTFRKAGTGRAGFEPARLLPRDRLESDAGLAADLEQLLLHRFRK
jgi:hypothetical protein